MSGILVQTREASPLLHEVRPQRAPRVVSKLIDPTRRLHQVPPTLVGLSDGIGDPPRRHHAQAPLSIGSLLHLGSVGLIAAGIVAVFFGAGFSLLVRTADGTVSASTDRADLETMSLPPSFGNVEQRAFFGQAPGSESKDAAQSSAALPAPTEMPAIDRKDDVPHLDPVSASKAPTDTPAVPANAPAPAPNSPAATALAPPTSGLSNAELTELLDHGDTLLRNGDVASARLFYERAAGAGDGRAALRLGATFDPAFLSRLGLGTLQANPAEARSWYSRARDLGAVDANRRLNSLETSRGNSFQ
jgi:hypothetical protein